MLSSRLMRSILVPGDSPSAPRRSPPRRRHRSRSRRPRRRRPAPALDFATFATKVQPLFLAKREGLMTCLTCHNGKVGTRLQLEPLPDGVTTWSEEAARKNFKSASSLVVPGSPTTSRLLLHPLNRDAGGDAFHGGGKHWQSQTDPSGRSSPAGCVAAAPATDARRPPPPGTAVRIIQTNAAGDGAHLIDPATNLVTACCTAWRSRTASPARPTARACI